MSIEGMREIVRLAEVDAEFRRKLERDPDRAMVQFDVTMTEIVAMKAKDAEILRAIGLDADFAERWELLWRRR